MITWDMAADNYYDTHKKEKSDYECICGYDLIKDSEYIDKKNNHVSVMICKSCGRTEYWVEEDSSSKNNNIKKLQDFNSLISKFKKRICLK